MADEQRPHDPSDVDLRELRSLVDQTRDVSWEPAPPHLWDAIEAATATPGLAAAGRRRRWWWTAAAAAVVAALVTAAVLVDRRSDDGRVVARVDLELLGDSGVGAAELIDRDGRFELRVQTSDLGAAPGYFEVWLIDTTVSQLVSLGPLRADGRYPLPQSLDPGQYPVVDISREPLDGDPAHSGDSVLRGELPI